jgi:hypothetical protein
MMLPEALRVAREHVNYSALQGLSPTETLRTVGIRPRHGHRPSWQYVEQEIGLQWLRLTGEINLKDKRGGYREAA